MVKTEVLIIHPVYPELDKIAQCADIIRNGGLVIFPTETVYGIAANGESAKAIKRLREVKKRSATKPFSFVVARAEDIEDFVSQPTTAVYKLVDAFWPGPLTIVVTSDAGKTVGVRMPDTIIAQHLIGKAQCPVVAPSANVKGGPPPVTCQQALKELNGLVDVAIDGGPAAVGTESSVVDITAAQPKMLREGAIALTDIERTAMRKTVLFVCTGNSCRSVMAEFLFKKMVGPDRLVEVLSAGTGVLSDMAASTSTVSLLQQEGIDASTHRAQLVTSLMLKKADLIFVMTQKHRQQLLRIAPSVAQRIYLLKEFAGEATVHDPDPDIIDPIGRPMPVYEECLHVIKTALNKVIDLL